MNDNNSLSCLDVIIFLIMFVNICLIRCDQVTEEDFNNKTKEIENMIKWQQKQSIQLKQQNDSLLLIIKEIKEK